MTTHLSKRDLEGYFERTLSSEELLIVDTHMSECEACSNKMAGRPSAKLSLADIFSDGDNDPHLNYEQFESYVDGEIDAVDREIADVHTRVCEPCSRSLDELVRLRTTLQTVNQSEQALAVVTVPPSLWDTIRTASFWRLAAPAFAVILICVMIWLAWPLTKTPPIDVAEVVDPAANTGDDPITANANTEAQGQTDSNSTLTPPTISLADGGTRIEIDSAGNLTGLNSGRFAGRVKSALTTQTIEISTAAKELGAGAGVLMGGERSGVSFGLTTPVGKVVQQDRPQFRWRPLKDTESYIVTIFDANFNKVAESPVLRQPTWTPGTPLKRGAIYQWQVTATRGDQEIKSPVRPAPDARFKIIDGKAANEITAAKRQGTSHLVLGILYANAGLMDEAEREFQALVNKNPKSAIARRLLNKITTAR